MARGRPICPKWRRAHRGFWASFQYLTLIGGQLCAIFVAILLQAVLTEAQLTAWGWRVPFVIGALLALGVYLLRRGLAATPSFENQAAPRPPSTPTPIWLEPSRDGLLLAPLPAGRGLGP